MHQLLSRPFFYPWPLSFYKQWLTEINRPFLNLYLFINNLILLQWRLHHVVNKSVNKNNINPLRKAYISNTIPVTIGTKRSVGTVTHWCNHCKWNIACVAKCSRCDCEPNKLPWWSAYNHRQASQYATTCSTNDYIYRNEPPLNNVLESKGWTKLSEN